MTIEDCPGCGHSAYDHVGGTCYDGWYEQGSACGTCGWSFIKRPEFTGWWNYRSQLKPPWVGYLMVAKDDAIDPAAAVEEAERILGLR